MKQNKDFRVSHVKHASRLTENAVMLGPLRGCHIPGEHFASDCEACKSIYGRYLKEREANIEARIRADGLAELKPATTPSPFIQRASDPA
jgi:hypothetical protein